MIMHLLFRRFENDRIHEAKTVVTLVFADSKPFRCKVCDRRFRRKDNLERHIRNTHPDHALGTAMELDETALTEQLTTATEQPATDKTELYENTEKSKLELLNPLPPISQETLNKHMHSEFSSNAAAKVDTTAAKSYIIEANIARESVIFGPVRREPPANKDSNGDNEYVHKKKKFNTWNQKVSEHGVTLPPIDKSKLMKIYDTFDSQEKFEKLKDSFESSNLEVMPPKNIEVYKNILNPERPEAEQSPDQTNGQAARGNGQNSSVSPQVHWRRKITLNINW